MKISVEIIFRSGSGKTVEIDWDDDAGPPRPDLVKNLGQTGLVSVDGSLLQWNAGRIDFIRVDGQFDEMLTGQPRDEEPREPREGECPSCHAQVWYEYHQGKWTGRCPLCALPSELDDGE